MRTIRILAGAAALVAGACAQPSSPSKGTPVPLTRLQSQPVSFMTFSGYTAATTLVVRDRESWQRTWNDLYALTSPIPALPEIDFSQQMVVVAALGSRPTSGYDIVMTAAFELDGVVTIEAESRSPSTCVTLPVVTSPVDIARLPKRSGNVVVHLSPVTVRCG